MDRKGWKGSITVFFSLTCILFLALICSTVESARVQGARAQTANITGMGTFSLLGEFEPGLLEKYGIFSLDVSYGSGSFELDHVEQHLREFLMCNADPRQGIALPWSFDPWNLELTDSKISGYALLTDEKGEPFYQQAVAYMKANLGSAAVSMLMESVRDAEKLETQQQEYEKRKRENDNEISGMEEQKQQRLEELESEAAASADSAARGEETTAVVPVEPPENPLQEIARLRKMSVLEIVTWDKKISEKEIRKNGLPSKGRLKKGNFSVEKKYSGLTADVLFREYLLEHFSKYADQEGDSGLDYQIEYLLGGKTSDKDNLKYVVTRLLLLREGMNYIYCVQDTQMNAQAGGLATALTGFLGIPLLTSATKHALLLAWAYGESLVDVRILLDGGKVPVAKDAESWALPLEKLAHITEILEQGAKGSGRGLEYRDYLRMLLHMGSRTNQKIRALDIIQMELQTEKETKNFRADHCMVAVRSTAKWHCRPVFLRLPQVIMGISAEDIGITQKSSMAY